MTLMAILIGTLVAGIGSVWLAAALSFGVLARYTQHMLSLAAGALLATAFMHLLPEAFESQVGPQALFATLLAGLVFFFLLTRPSFGTMGTSTVATMAMPMVTNVIMDMTTQANAAQGRPKQVQPPRGAAWYAKRQAWGRTMLQVAGRCWRVTACMPLATAY